MNRSILAVCVVTAALIVSCPGPSGNECGGSPCVDGGRDGGADGGVRNCEDAGVDARCSLANCRAMASSCRVEFTGGPDLSACRDAGSWAGFDFQQYCPAQCNASANGAVAQCLADQAQACSATRDAGGTTDAIVSGCLDPSRVGPEATCATSCASEERSCNGACPQTSYQACMDCSSRCGLARVCCENACPRQ
ncbi:MAG: hypothetical protein ACYC8T_37775 [Myxococcaceae bacterium]